MRLFEFEDDKFCLVTEHDFQGMDFVWYSSPVSHYDIRECYARIASFDQLEYYAEVFFYLNPDIDKSLLLGIFQWLGNRENGKTVRTYGKHRISEMIDKVYQEKKEPWCRRMRRVIFNPNIIIPVEEKMSVTAHMIGKGITYQESDLKQTIEELYRMKVVATVKSISSSMGCSERTIHRLMTPEIKGRMEENNKTVRRENKIEKALEWIDVLSSDGDNVKMRILKDLTKIRDYSILKEALHRYEHEL